MKRKFNDLFEADLQLFAGAPAGLVDTEAISVRAREVDFVTSFAKSTKSFLELLGIMRMTEKKSGETLTTITVTGALESGHVGEGEEIPLSRYTVTEDFFDKIEIEKFRKGVSIEAISKYGYDIAVQRTDDKMKAELRRNIQDTMFRSLQKGTLVDNKPTFQAAVAGAIGKVTNKLDERNETCAGIAVWVNIEDLFDYLGTKEITLETTFGMNYVKNFLGADLLFASSRIDPNTVVATPLDNMVAYYVDPANSDFVKAGFHYTIDTDTRFVGFHIQGSYDRTITDTFAIMGVRIFAEDLGLIAHVAIGDAPTQTLGALTLTSEAGTEAGMTAVTVDPQLSGLHNRYKYKTNAGTATEVTYGMDVKLWTKWDGESEIEVTNGHHVTVVECTSDYKAIASGDVVAVTNMGA